MVERPWMIGRRSLLAVSGALLGVAARAQKVHRIALLSGASPDASTLRTMVDPMRKGLRDLGYQEGINLQLDVRFADGRLERLPALLAELLERQPDLIVTTGLRPPLLVKEAAITVPVVALAVDDPVAMGIADSIARPGRNFTGLSGAFTGLLARRMQLLRDVVPKGQRFAILFNPESTPRDSIERERASAAARLDVAVSLLELRTPEDFDEAFARIARERIDGVSITADPLFYAGRARLAELCLKHRLPSVWGGAGYLDAGGLMSYQGDFAEISRRAASLVDKILKGAKPGDIPFEQSTKLELAVSLKVARALGIAIPRSVLVSADLLIE